MNEINPPPAPLSDPQQVPQTPPPPPTAESQVGVRTMAGDISSLSSSGGLEPQPQTFNPRDLMNNEPAFQPQGQQPPMQSGMPVQPGAPAQPGVSPQPQSQSLVPSQTDLDAYRKHHMKMLLISVASVSLVVILGAASYFIFFKKAPEPVDITPVIVVPPEIIATISATPTSINEGEPTALTWETTNATEVTIEGMGPVELKGTKIVNPTETITYRLVAKAADGSSKEATAEVIVIPKPVVIAFTHTSMFPPVAAITSINLTLATLTTEEIKAALIGISGPAAEPKVPVLREFVTILPDGIADAHKFFPALLPALATPDFSMPIEKDFTAFFYKDKDGAWPGYIITVSPDKDASIFLKEIEKSPKVFYLTDPGAPKATAFKAGTPFTPNFQSARYLPYTKTGASFQLATAKIADKNYILISTSYAGIKEAIKQLGF